MKHILYEIGERFIVYLTFGKEKIKIIYSVQNMTDNDQWRIKEKFYQNKYLDKGYPDKVYVKYWYDMKNGPNRKNVAKARSR